MNKFSVFSFQFSAKTATLLAMLILLAPGAQAQLVIQGQATIKMATVPPLKSETPNTSVGTQDALSFRNGDLLYGRLLAVDAEHGVSWQHADTTQPIDFKTDNVTQIDFPTQPAPAFRTENPCHVRFHNDEALDGNLVSCDAQNVVLDTWQAGRLKLTRSAVQSVTMISEAPAIFAGPTGKEGWTSGKSAVAAAADSGEWSYRNGAFYAVKAASIARDLKLPDVAEIQFDLAWKGSLYVAIALYTDSLQPVNLVSKENEPDFGGFYSLQINGTFLDLKPITKHDPLRSLGQLIIPSLSEKPRAHFDLRASKTTGKIALFINGALVIEWTDPQGFVGKGTGMRFVHQGMGAAKLSGLRVTQWDGQMPEKAGETVAETQDVAWLINGTRSAGVVEGIHDGKLVIQGELGKSEISLARLRQIKFATPKDHATAGIGGKVRASLAQGLSLTLDLEKWGPDGVTVSSPNFGRATFKTAAFTRLQFAPFPKTAQPSGLE